MSWELFSNNQPNVVKILTNSMKKNRLAHAYIFEGSRGVGKRAIALHLAKYYFCINRNGVNPCMECSECKRIDSRNHPNVHTISPDGQSIKKDQVSYLQKEFSFRGVESKRKFYIIEHADKMTASAANSLLKFLEEPVSETIAVLTTENTHAILNTIQSRSQIVSFSPLSPKGMVELLVNNGILPQIASVLALLTTDLAEAENLCTDDWVVQARNLVIQLTEEIFSRPHQVMFTLQEKWLELFKGKEQLDLGLDLLLLWYRDLLYTQIGQTSDLVYIDQKERLEELALYRSREKLSKQLSAIYEAKRHLSANVNPQLLMEKLLVRLQEG